LFSSPGNSSDTSSLSSRDSSPDRQDHSFEALPTSALATLGHDAADGREDSKPKELKARRRTATPQVPTNAVFFAEAAGTVEPDFCQAE